MKNLILVFMCMVSVLSYSQNEDDIVVKYKFNTMIVIEMNNVGYEVSRDTIEVLDSAYLVVNDATSTIRILYKDTYTNFDMLNYMGIGFLVDKYDSDGDLSLRVFISPLLFEFYGYYSKSTKTFGSCVTFKVSETKVLTGKERKKLIKSLKGTKI